jgi:hypothetical protein
LLIECEYHGTVTAYNPFLAKKVKKSEIFSRYPLDFFPENSIIGFTLERVPQNGPDETEARETSGKIEGIGDMLSDGPRRFLGSLDLRKTGQTI